MTQETPAKILSLLGVSLFSMAFLLAVSVTNANFSGTEKPVALDPFAPAKVVAMIDNASASYSSFFNDVLVKPGQQDFAMAADNIAFIGQGAGSQIMQYMGFTGNSPSAGRVAGAFTQVSNQAPSQSPAAGSGGFSIDSLYSLLIR